MNFYESLFSLILIPTQTQARKCRILKLSNKKFFDLTLTIFLAYFMESRALDKTEYLMIIFLFYNETICCDPSSEPSSQDICFYSELTKIIPKYH